MQVILAEGVCAFISLQKQGWVWTHPCCSQPKTETGADLATRNHQKYSESCFRLPLGSTWNVTQWGRSRGSQVSPADWAVLDAETWTAGLWSCSAERCISEQGQAGGNNPESTGQMERSPTPPHWPHHTGIFLPNRHMNRRGEKPSWKQPHSRQSKEKTHTEQGKKPHSAQL